ncbi:MAG: hypothetical protein ABIC82_01475 [bacterium]
MKRKPKGKTAVLGLFNSSDSIVLIDSRVKTLAKIVEQMNMGQNRFSLEELIQQLDVLLIQLQTNGGRPLCKKDAH